MEMKTKINTERNKKAVSLMISYVLLIVIAISLSILVYAWVSRMWVFTTPECRSGVSLIITNYVCDNATKLINITIKNKGRYNVTGYYIKGADNKTQKIMFPLNISDPRYLGIVENGKYYFFGFLARPLRPGEEETSVFSYDVGGITKPLEKIQIAPFITKDEDDITCDKATIYQEVNCGKKAGTGGSSAYVP